MATVDRAPGVQRLVGAALVAAGLIAIGVITLTPVGGPAYLPFLCMTCGERPGVDVILNILLFAPVGVGLSLYGLGFRRVLLYGFLATVGVELLQAFVIPGRYASLRDILANTAGAALGGVAGGWWRVLTHPSPVAARVLFAAAAVMWFTGQAFTAWALGFAPPRPPWWAQLRPEYDRFPAEFKGTIVAMSLGSVPIVESDLVPRPDEARRQLLDGAPMRVVVTNAPPTRGTAPIVIISSGPNRDVAFLAQDGRDAVFSATVRGTLIGLRTPSVRIRDVAPAAGDSLALSAAIVDGRYHLRADVGGMARERSLAGSASHGWAFLLPIPLYAFGPGVYAVTAAWLAAICALLGYWAARAATPRARLSMAVAILGSIATSLAVAPVMYGLPAGHWSEWIAAGAGAAAGWLAGGLTRAEKRDQSRRGSGPA